MPLQYGQLIDDWVEWWKLLMNWFHLVPPQWYLSLVLVNTHCAWTALSKASTPFRFNLHWWNLRTYPPHFGLRLVKLFPKLVECRCLPPEIPAPLEAESAQQFFDSLTWDADIWEDADMFSCLAYIRGNTNLRLGEWRTSFPQSLWSERRNHNSIMVHLDCYKAGPAITWILVRVDWKKVLRSSELLHWMNWSWYQGWFSWDGQNWDPEGILIGKLV